jgi:mRNA interferase YafQ
MLNSVITGPFKRDRKLMQKRGKDLQKLTEVIDLLINEQPLPPKHEDHPLHGNQLGKRECHVEPDWLLIYRIDKKNREVFFYNTGTHSDLF